MSFTLKTKEQLFGIKQIVNGNIPVFAKKLGPNVVAEANRDNTIFVNEDAPDSYLQKNLTIPEELEHLLQMKRGNQYTDNYIVENTPSEFNMFKRDGDNIIPITNKAQKTKSEGDPSLAWEAEAKYNAKNNTNNVQDMVS
jgi:hypothetical protein